MARFSVLAYSGGAIRLPWWGKTIFDTAGLSFATPLPVLREHDRGKIVGRIDRVATAEYKIHAEGTFSSVTQDGAEVLALAKEGFPWQASIGCFPELIQEVKEKQTVTVNGRSFGGPAVVIRRARVREISVVVLGADDQTSALPLAASASLPTDYLEAIELEWQGGPALRQEFPDFGAYLAFKRAESAGLVSIIAKQE
jgi:hypothetical protein